MSGLPPPPAHTHHYGPLHARNPDLEVLLTDGLGGFALSSVAGVPTRCYSGLVVSGLPPVQRSTHLVSPLEVLSVGGQTYALHTLELAPGVFEGGGLELLSGVTLRDLLPERVQMVGGVRVTRQMVSPAHAGAVVYLYTVDSREAVTLTLGGYFVDRDMHHVHVQAPELEFETEESQVLVKGQRTTRVRIHAPDAQITPLTPQPFPQRVYYRHDAARGEPDHEYTRGAALWEVAFPAGGGGVALVVQGLTDTTPDIPDPWLAYEREATRRRELAELAGQTCGVTDELVATLAVAADAYLVRRNSPAGTSVIAGYPWFADWGRDAMISLTGLTLLTGRFAEARDLLHTFLSTLRRGLIPNHFLEYGQGHEDGQGAGYNTVDGALWLAVALERYVDASTDLDFAREALPQLRELLSWHLRGTDHGIRVDPADGLLLAGEAGVQLTWMDVKIEDWVVTPRHGKPVEIQGLWTAALGAETRISEKLGEPPEYAEALSQALGSFGQFWDGEGFADVLNADGTLDVSVRPNAALALALPDTPATPAQVEAAVRQTEAELLTPLGLHTLSPRDPRYRGNYGGPQVLRDAAYHQGTVWPWPLTAYVELLLSRGEVQQARAALDGLRGHVWEAGVGHVSEVFSGDGLRPGGCAFQAWSVAELLRGHVLVSRAEQQQNFAQNSG
ncbi:amylo-alpha-1,6-glucosidase [Deinococcus arenicola]|uniref:Glycogen debranching enzyme N-terminal domain-containing protein n=1 Tax=Deinococcus arenicola TaxID=2994950 RepID=A0ABU4DPF9_9DEIO|nr:amylo-alpha-1,6-glucosidase [Deinococcus sp. ZS9-10]MDV6374321.1 glycogen debranching enzyme N-terminal domain-containing protein [Deinococcus sp. ZS9-10]